MEDKKNEKENFKEYIFSLNNSEFKTEIVKINENMKLMFMIRQINIITNYYYKCAFALDELKSLNKIFRIFDTIDEVFKELCILFDNKRVSLKIESHEILIILHISNISSSKTEEVILKIPQIIYNKDEKIELMLQDIKEIKKSKINLEKKIEILEKENEKLIQTINELKITVKELVDEKLKKEKYYINSKIIDEIEETKLLYDRIINKGFFKNKNIKFQLIYRASRDGDSSSIYKKKILDIKNLLCIIQTKKGCKFGGFTEVSPDYSKQYFNDKNAFIFSLNKMKIYDYLEDNCSVQFTEGYGPIFTFGFCVVSKNFFKGENNNVSDKSNSRFYYQDNDYEINDGESKFSINELEIFQII